MTVRIGFASTAYGPLWRPAVDSWMRCLLTTQHQLVSTGQGSIAAVGITDRTYTHSADNRIVHDFLLADPPLTHLFHTEMDMILPDDAILRLLALDKPIASGVYFLRQGQGQPCLYVRGALMGEESCSMSPVALYPQDAPFTLRGCPGLGCVLFQRSVFEQVDFPWFDLKEGHYGHDLYFFTKALKAGVETWVDPRVRCGQIEYKVWDHGDYEQRMHTDPQFAATGWIIGSTT